jgi:serine O-acetyltransferase
MNRRYIEQLYREHRSAPRIPSPDLVCNWLSGLLGILFPEFSNRRFQHANEFEHHFLGIKLDMLKILELLDDELESDAEALEKQFCDRLPGIREQLLLDAQAIHDGDPAAVSLTEVIRSYPGFYAIAVYRLAHAFYQLGVPLIPRMLTEHAHSKTGIDIHPAADIGERFCIDHGTGVVIGETVRIGANVKLYQGVTLGALSVKKELAKTKRHPTIEDHVVIYAGATILGGETVIGHHSVIGGNVWLTKSVPPFSRVYYAGDVQKTEEITH